MYEKGSICREVRLIFPSNDSILMKILKKNYYFIWDVWEHLHFFMPPTSEKLRGHIGLGLSVRPSVRLSIRPSVRNSLAAEKLNNRLC